MSSDTNRTSNYSRRYVSASTVSARIKSAPSARNARAFDVSGIAVTWTSEVPVAPEMLEQ